MQNLTVFQEIKAVTACLNTQFKGFNMDNQQLGDAPMPFFAEKSVKRNMSKEEITEVIGMLTEVLENVSLEIYELNPFRANPTKWSNTLKQFVGNSRGIA